MIDKIALDNPLTMPSDTYSNIFVQVNLEEYKYNEETPFSIQSQLKIEFLPYKYVLTYKTDKFEKNYGEFLNLDERNSITSACVKAVFEEIKEKSGSRE